MAKKERGFSLIEILIAIVVLTVGIWGVSDLMVSSRRTAAATDYRLQGNALAQLKLAELKAAAGAKSLINEKPKDQAVLPAEGTKPFEQNPRYAWRAVLKRDPANPARTDIRVEVSRTGDLTGRQPVITAVGFEMAAAGTGAGKEKLQ